ncbi:hypothetical protein GCM10011371_29890 [Novosphingobium marinum]|uniref:AcrR family transcriptional regulator n=1 Tax=Novosphingobium marinum TaxID=1514948 RepID=A0A7Y9XY43_9SPHN|nr:TetR/AcrR family transcriptional regulator [Novosphingobium marinum]NYH96749.1 AcrR family transcriptional regulator [Novosphingobium marinum]GGC40520.1 hypothetical protein GCM10011371_29890 [Novosphingobium marinum]
MSRDDDIRPGLLGSMPISWLDQSEWIIEARQARSRETFRKILDAAVKLFVEKGFDGTTMAQIAAAAGIAPGSIYRRFADKEGLLNSVIDSYYRTRIDEFDRLVEERFRSLDTAEQILELYNRMIFSAYRKDRGLIRLVERRSHTDAGVREKQRRSFVHVSSAIADVLAAAMPATTVEELRKQVLEWHLVQRGILVSLILPDGTIEDAVLSLDDPTFEARVLSLSKAWIL